MFKSHLLCSSFKISFLVFLCTIFSNNIPGLSASTVPKASDLWLRYDVIKNDDIRDYYKNRIGAMIVEGNSNTMNAIRIEMETAINRLLSRDDSSSLGKITIIAGTPENSQVIRNLGWADELSLIGDEGFIIRTARSKTGDDVIAITSNGEIGVLYGTFHFLRQLQLHKTIDSINIVESPRIQHRMLNHWDNIMPTRYGTVERGYAGRTLWIWDDLPNRRATHYTDYARAMASIGLNGVVLNNVNSEPQILKTEYLEKVAALADIFRPYGIRLFLSASFAAPLRPADRPRFKEWGGIGDLDTADPLDPRVQQWWSDKADEIYGLIPDFGGFLVKADSEGMHGPQSYGRNHADGANMLAEAIARYGGLVIWRAFVYDGDVYEDRAKSAYGEFKPYDGRFHENVVVQVKNGPLDFQPREPVHPLFGSMSLTPLAMEFQITQEYLGHNIHLVYLGTKWKEILDFDTFSDGEHSTVAKVIDGTLHNYKHTVIAGVANLGIGPRPVNWTGHPFGQANWYAFGRLAWDPTLDPESIAEEWVRMTWSTDSVVVTSIVGMMMGSWEAAVDYMSPLGLNFTIEGDPHYDPAPDRREGRFFYSNESGIGYDRTVSGTNALAQYHPGVAEQFMRIETIPERYLLWFHFVPWDYRLQSGRTLWEELVTRYNEGVVYVERMLTNWTGLESKITQTRHAHITWLLTEQLEHARYYRDECLDYFSSRSGRSFDLDGE
jgi:alpha-glucuronidase